MTMSSARKITLKSSDGQLFDVEESIAMQLVTVKSFFEDETETAKVGTIVPLPMVSAKYLSLIMEYLKEQPEVKSESDSDKAKKAYDEKFAGNLGNEELKEMLLAVNYLDVKSLQDVINQGVADRIQNWSVPKVRAFFGVENDFSPEEEAEIRQQYAWAHDNVED